MTDRINPNRFYVYIHRRCDTNEVFYVGKGSNGRSHSVKGRSAWWTAVYEKCGRTVEFVEVGLTEDDAFDLETETIKFYRECGHTLCNLTDGGEGVSGYKPTPEVSAKISDAVSKEVLCSNGMVFKSCREAAKWLGKEGAATQISRCCRREKRTSHGHVWRYTTDCDDLKDALESGKNAFHDTVHRYSKERPTKRITVYCSNGMIFESVKSATEWLSSVIGRKAHSPSVSRCCRNKRNSLYGYKFSYEDIFSCQMSE